jgi:hypothetical protein
MDAGELYPLVILHIPLDWVVRMDKKRGILLALLGLG